MTSNTTLERTVNHCGRIVLAVDCLLAERNGGGGRRFKESLAIREEITVKNALFFVLALGMSSPSNAKSSAHTLIKFFARSLDLAVTK